MLTINYNNDEKPDNAKILNRPMNVCKYSATVSEHQISSTRQLTSAFHRKITDCVKIVR